MGFRLPKELGYGISGMAEGAKFGYQMQNDLQKQQADNALKAMIAGGQMQEGALDRASREKIATDSNLMMGRKIDALGADKDNIDPVENTLNRSLEQARKLRKDLSDGIEFADDKTKESSIAKIRLIDQDIMLYNQGLQKHMAKKGMISVQAQDGMTDAERKWMEGLGNFK